MIINKASILAGDQNQFAILLRTHFLAMDEPDNKREAGVSERVAIARAVQSQTVSIEWQQPDVDAFLADIEKKSGELASVFKAEIQFHIVTLQQFASALCMDEQLTPALNQLNTQLLAHAIADAQFWWQDRPLKELVNTICQYMAGWSESYGVTSESLKGLFVKSIEQISGLTLLNQDEASQLSESIAAEFHKLLDKFDRLAQRLKDSEVGLLKAIHGKALVARFLNQATQGKKLPIYIIQLLQDLWLKEMQILVIKQGETSTHWLRWKKLVETMIRFYQPGMNYAEDPTSRNIMLSLSNEFEQLIRESLPETADGFEDFCNQLAYDFSQQANGKELDGLAIVSPVAIDGEVVGIDKKITSVLINKAKSYEKGQWFLYTNDTGNKLRCRLLFSIPEFDQLLFVTLVGQKALVMDYERFAYLLSAKLITPLLQQRQLETICSLSLDKLLDNFEELHEARLSLRKQKEMEARKAKEENEKRLAAEKARAEAEAIARRKAEEEQIAVLAKVADDMKRQARLAINSLALGSWVDIYNEAGKNYRRAKLAVKYAATGRFVFVDADGITVADNQRDELVEMMMDRKLKLLESDGQFAERLTQIIKNIRKVD